MNDVCCYKNIIQLMNILISCGFVYEFEID